MSQQEAYKITFSPVVRGRKDHKTNHIESYYITIEKGIADFLDVRQGDLLEVGIKKVHRSKP